MKGVLPGCLVMVVEIRWHGSTVQLALKSESGPQFAQHARQEKLTHRSTYLGVNFRQWFDK